MTVQIPSPRKTPWYSSETTRAVFEILATTVAGVIVLLRALRDMSGKTVAAGASPPGDTAAASATTTSTSGSAALDAVFLLALVAMVLIAINGAFRLIAARKRDRDTNHAGDPKHLLAPLRVLYALVAKRKGIGTDEASRRRFRVTLHRNDVAKGEHEQCVPYVGGKTLDPREAKAIVGRRWPNSLGLVGLAIRSKDQPKRVALSEKVCDVDSYVQELVDLYGYTEEQARQLQPVRLDALAIPLQSDGQVIGVVYADSSDRNFFDNETIDLCILICGAITQHILTTYTKG